MKKLRILIILFAWSSVGFAQQVNYKIIKDDPSTNSKLNLNLDLAQMDFNSVIDASSFNLGLWGSYNVVNNRILVDFSLRKSWLALGRLGNSNYPGNLELNLGGDLYLTSHTKTRSTKVVLDVKDQGTTYKNGDRYQVSEVTYIMVPGTYHSFTGVRGGVYYKSNLYIFDPEKLGVNSYDDHGGKMTSAGIYGGIIKRNLHTLVINTDQYGQCSNSLGVDLYADVLILPVNKFMSYGSGGDSAAVDETAFIKDHLGKNPFGFRIGLRGYQIAPKADTDKKFGMSYSFEAGLKPYLGIFFNCGIGITIVK